MPNKSLLEQLQEQIQENEKPLTLKQAAAFLNLKPATLYSMTHKKKIPFSKPGGKVLFFLKSDLIKWMRSNRVKSEDQIEEEAANYLMSK